MTINYLSSDVVMAGKDHDLIKDTRLHLQNVRNLNIIIEVLDSNNAVLDTIHGIVDSGSINVEGDSLIRRTGSITMTMIDKVIPRSGNLIWLTNKIRVYVGIRDNLSSQEEDITHYCVGTFYVSQADTTIAQNGKTVTVNLEDYMMKWDAEQLEETIVIEAEIPLHIAVTNTMNMLGEFNLDVEMTNVNIPSDMEFSVGDSVTSVIQQLRDLYMDYECYYTVDGIFTFKKMKVQLDGGEDVKWVFDESKDLSVSITKTYNFKDVKNTVKVVGRTLNDGSTVTGEYTINDKNNPFHVDNIGGKRLKVVNDTTLFTTAQCESMAVYELHNSSNMQETFSITTVPIYFLDANDIIEVYNEERESFDRMVVKSISFNLEVGSTMSISANKLYYNTFNLSNIPIEMYRAIADEIVDKIKNNGWLSLAETRIYEKFGLQGRGGADVRIRFQYQERYGVTAYVVAYPTSRAQTMVIDLADFQLIEGDSGDNGNGKGDYADRILGHETLHLVMNDDFGAKKTGEIPEWYKEGLAELLHGADERTKNVIVVNNAIDDTILLEVINRAYSLLMGSTLQVESTDYVASYILCKIIAMKLKENNTNFQNFHDTIRISSLDGNSAFHTAILTHIGSLETLTDYVSNNGVNFVKTVMNLDIGVDEVDTGSIAGSDYGGEPLNAENVFDNSTATKGVFLNRFNVIVEKP